MCLMQNCYFCYTINKRTITTSLTRFVKKFEEIPGPKSLPLIGTLHKYFPIIGSYKFDRLHHNGLKKFIKYGPIVREEIIPGVNIVWLFKPEDIETMFRFEGKFPMRRSHLALEKFRIDRPNVYNTGGLLPTNGLTWMKLRKVFQKGLSSPTSVQQFLPSINEIIDEWFHYLDGVQRADYQNDLSRLFLELTALTTLDIRLKSFSKQELKKSSRSSRLIKAAYTTNNCILKTDNGMHLWRYFETPLYRKLRKSQEFMEEQAIDLLSLKLSLFNEADVNKSTSLLESYFASPELDFKDIIGMVCDFLLAGIDTTTYTTSFLFYHLARNPTIQDKLSEEAKHLLNHSNQYVDVAVLNQAHYAKAVLKELFRLQPISVGIGRVLDSEAVFSDFLVPKGTIIVSQNQVSCRLEEYFPSPNEFIPERWLKTHPLYKQHHPYLVIPFGHGPRSCIARRLAEQNILVLMLKLFRNFKIAWNGSEMDSRSLLINQPDKPLSISFIKQCQH